MKTSTVLLIGGGGYVLWYLSQLGVATNTVRVVFDRVNIKSITNYEFIMTVQNVSNIPVNVNSMSGEILLNGNFLASMGFFDTKTAVPANGQISIPINVSLSMLSLPMVVKNIIEVGLGTLKFTVIGDVNVNGLVLPFNLDKVLHLG